VISSFTPTSGPVGTVVTLTGTGFMGVSLVKFNTSTATSFTVVSDTQITATVPSGATSGKISATSAAGAGLSLADFKVNLLSNASFELDANGDTRPDNWTSNSLFTRFNTVSAVDGSYVGRHLATANNGYTISQAVNNLVAGTRYNFTGSVNIPATSDTFTFTLNVQWRNASNSAISTTTIKQYTASTGGTWDQVVANMVAPAATTNALVRMAVSSLNATIYVDDFLFVVPSINPNGGPTGGGQTVAIPGTNLSGTTAVTFGGTAATIIGTTATEVTVTTPTHAAGVVDVVVTTPGGNTSLPGGYTYLASPGSPPVISSFTPSTGPLGTVVTLTGTGFTGVSLVKFNKTTADSFTINSDTQITVAVPSGATSGKISVTNIAGTGLSPSDFKVNLLLNPSFELDANGDTRPDNWTSNSLFTRSNAVSAVNGSFVGRHFAAGNNGYTISQTVNNLVAGTSYSFTGSVNIPATSDAFTFTLNVLWRNASNGSISTTTIKQYTASTGVDWDPAALANMVAPAGTTNALVRMVVTSLNATIYVDNFLFGP